MNKSNWPGILLTLGAFINLSGAIFLIMTVTVNSQSPPDPPEPREDDTSSQATPPQEQPLPNLSEIMNNIPNVSLGPELEEEPDNSRETQETECDASEIISSIEHVHPNQGVHVRLRESGNVTYVFKNTFYPVTPNQPSSDDSTSNSRFQETEFTFISYEAGQVTFQFRNYPGMPEGEVCEDSLEVSPQIVATALPDEEANNTSATDEPSFEMDNWEPERGTSQVADWVNSRQVEENRWEIDPREKEALEEHMETLREEVEVTPVRNENGEPAGLRLDRIEENSLLRQRGFQQEDVIRSINDTRLESRGQLRELLTSGEFQGQTEITLEVLRRGEARELHFSLGDN